jgi:hypothetical protein
MSTMSMFVPCDLDDFRGLSGRVRDEEFLATEREIRRLQAVQAARVRVVETSGSYGDDQFLSVTSWAQGVLNSARDTATAVVRSGRLLVDLPILGAAVNAGSVGSDQLRLLGRLHANDRCRPQLAEFDQILTDAACALTLRQFRQVCEKWEAHADPDGNHTDHEASRKNRSVHLSRIGTGFALRAEGDALTGEMLETIINAHAEAEYLTDVAQRLSIYGDTADQHPLARTGVQRRYDAFVNVIFKGAGTTQAGGVSPIVNILCTETVLKAAIREFMNATPENLGEVAVSDRFRLCETAAGTPISNRDLVIAAMIGHIRRVVVDSTGRVIDLGRRNRLFTGAAREAALLSGNTCCWPGCDSNQYNIQIDHLTGWAVHKGSTSPANAAPMCAKHNRAKHNHQITVKRDHTGWHHYRPDGTEIAPRTG